MAGRWTKVLRSLVVVGAVGSLAGGGAFSAFSSSTENPGNSFAAGTVALADNDAGAAMYSVAGARPGDAEVKCIRVSYSGSLTAAVKLFTDGTVGSLGQYLNLKIESGTQSTPSFPSCTGFVPKSGAALFTGTLAGFASAHNSFANGLADDPGSASGWATGDAVVYRFTTTLQDTDAAQGLSTGAHAFRWEARNQ